MRVKIVRCSGSKYWYKNRIGEIFEVTTGKEYSTVKPINKNSTYGVILKKDAIVYTKKLENKDKKEKRKITLVFIGILICFISIIIGISFTIKEN
jgi:hypothetical protein